MENTKSRMEGLIGEKMQKYKFKILRFLRAYFFEQIYHFHLE